MMKLYDLFKIKIERNNKKGEFSKNEETLEKMNTMLAIDALTLDEYMELYALMKFE